MTDVLDYKIVACELATLSSDPQPDARYFIQMVNDHLTKGYTLLGNTNFYLDSTWRVSQTMVKYAVPSDSIEYTWIYCGSMGGGRGYGGNHYASTTPHPKETGSVSIVSFHSEFQVFQTKIKDALTDGWVLRDGHQLVAGSVIQVLLKKQAPIYENLLDL
jgi:hypothetical protein